ncbi:MAG TPA: extracellular solute-binding protein [Candidatus Polarisedimenticolaceae bacterium]|nr:extracellular solute-binding protein [Candidatus Polarisedimenticolaceae bacterium]
MTQRRYLFLLIFFLVTIAWFTPLFAQAIDIDAAKKEARVVVYAAVPPQTMKVINDPFEKKFGIRVEYWRASTTGILERALNEWRVGQAGADVIEGNKGPQLILKSEGVFDKFMPPSAGKFPQQFLEADGILTPWRFNPISILYNTELVKKEELPKTLSDLLLPLWKGRITIPDPSRHTTTAQFLADLDRYDGVNWREFAKSLAQQQPLMVESFAPIVNTVIKGEAHLGITYLKYVGQYKGPIDYVRLNKYLADTNYMGVSKKAAHPNAGKLYVEYICSPEGQKAMAATGEFVLAPQVSPAFQGAADVAQRTLFMEEPSAEEFKKLREEMRQIFLVK